MRKRLINQRAAKGQFLLILSFLLLLPNLAWGQTTITIAGISPGENGDFTDESGQYIKRGKASFNETTNTLTLEKASISGIIQSSVSPLTVHLIGSSVITPTDNNDDVPIQYTGTDSSPKLLLESSEEEDGEITLNGTIAIGGSDTERTIYMGSVGGYDVHYLDDNQELSNFQTPDANPDKFKYWVIADSKRVFYNPHYDITFNHYEVTRINKDNILKSNASATPTVAFEPSTNTLTLFNAGITTTNTINGTNVIESGLDKLTVYLEGSNTINCVYDNDCVFKGTKSGAKVIFTTDATTPGSLSGRVNQESNMFADITPEYQGLSYTREGVGFTIGSTYYGIKIGGVDITSACLGSDGTISGVPSITSGTVQFDPNANKLSLKGATIDCSISNVVPIQSSIKELEVYVYGSNTIKMSSSNAFKYTGGETSATLTMTSVNPADDYKEVGLLEIVGINVKSDVANGYTVKGLVGNNWEEISAWADASNTEDDGWRWYSESSPASIYLFYRTLFDLWLVSSDSSTRFYYDNCTRYITDGLSPNSETEFNPNTSTLTCIHDGYHIYSGLSELTLKTGYYTNFTAISFGSPNGETIGATSGTLTIENYNESSTDESFTLNSGTSDPAIYGFSDVTYDDFTILSDGATYDNKSDKRLETADGAAITHVTFTNNLIEPEIFGKATSTEGTIQVVFGGNDQAFSSFKYSIEYGDGSEGVTEATYDDNNRPMISKPALITVYRVLNGKDGKVATGKYFGYPDAPYTLVEGETLTPEIYPAITAGVETESYSSSNTDIATFTNGKIGAEAAGTATLSTTLTDNKASFTVLNLENSGQFTVSFTVNVGESLDDLFASGQVYGTYYNTSTTSYKVPDGITAYIVTGVNGDKVTIVETKVIPPNTPVLLERGDKAIAFTHTAATDADGNLPSGNLLRYATSKVTVPEDGQLYVLFNGEFVKATADSDIESKCYLDLSSQVAVNGVNARGLYEIGDSDTTGIQSMDNGQWIMDNASDEWFDIQGRRIQKPTKAGLYIRNGKKVVVYNK